MTVRLAGAGLLLWGSYEYWFITRDTFDGAAPPSKSVEVAVMVAGAALFSVSFWKRSVL